MAFVKRIFLFLAINFLVIITISLVLNLLGVRPYVEAYGLNLRSLLIFCMIWGMAGAFISLGLSRIMAKWMMGIELIPADTRDAHSKELLQMVKSLCDDAGIPMPEVGVYNSKEVNAFATGPTKKRSLIAVSSGLLERMNRDEIKGVLGHEVAHIANGDMVTMTLLQGIINAFVMFLARVLAYAVSGLGKNQERSSSGSYFTYMMLVFFFEVIFMVLGSLVIAAYSRSREYRADQGGAHLAGKEKMIGALQALQKVQEMRDPRAEKSSVQAFKISIPKKTGFLRLFATHPPLEDRIARLRQ
jgi:heat shock protein HtpX